MSNLALAFLLFFFGGIIAALTYAPVSAFVTYLAVYFINPDLRWWSASLPGLRYSFMTVAIMMLAFTINFKEISEKALWKDQKTFIFLALFALTYVFVKNHALIPFDHSRFTGDFVNLTIVIFIAYKIINSEAALKASIYTYMAGAAYIGYQARVTGRDWQGRVEDIGMIDTGGDSNYTAAALAPAIVFCIYYLWQGDKKTKLFSLICAALIANGLVLINSRGSFVAVVGSAGLFFIFMIFSKYQEKGQRAVAILTIAAGLGGGLAVTDQAFWDRMATLKEVDEGGGGSHRTDFWWASLEAAKDHPLGMGVSGFQSISFDYVDEKYRKGAPKGVAVHSTWFQALNEVGYIGVTLLLLIIFSAYRATHHVKKLIIEKEEYKSYFLILSIECALLSYLLAATFINRTRAVALLVLVLYMLCAANIYGRISQKRERI